MDMSDIYPQPLYFVQLQWVAVTVRPEHVLSRQTRGSADPCCVWPNKQAAQQGVPSIKKRHSDTPRHLRTPTQRPHCIKNKT